MKVRKMNSDIEYDLEHVVIERNTFEKESVRLGNLLLDVQKELESISGLIPEGVVIDKSNNYLVYMAKKRLENLISTLKGKLNNEL